MHVYIILTIHPITSPPKRVTVVVYILLLSFCLRKKYSFLINTVQSLIKSEGGLITLPDLDTVWVVLGLCLRPH